VLKQKVKMLAGVGTVLAMGASGAFAATSADYTQALATDGDEGVVADFNLFDFAVGAALTKAVSVTTPGTITVGDTFKGHYQSYVASHQLNGVVQSALGLNTTGAGAGYELTVIAEYDEVILSVGLDGSFTSEVTGGSASLLFDTSPDYSFTSDTGFSDGETILTGAITGGRSLIIPAVGAGFALLEVTVTDQNADIFSPDIASLNGVFTLALNGNSVAGVTSVLGNPIAAGDVLLGADGNLEVQPVPLPAAAWLLGSALVGMTTLGRRAKA